MLNVTHKLWHTNCDQHWIWHTYWHTIVTNAECDTPTVTNTELTHQLWQMLNVTSQLWQAPNWHTNCDKCWMWHTNYDKYWMWHVYYDNTPIMTSTKCDLYTNYNMPIVTNFKCDKLRQANGDKHGIWHTYKVLWHTNCDKHQLWQAYYDILIVTNSKCDAHSNDTPIVTKTPNMNILWQANYDTPIVTNTKYDTNYVPHVLNDRHSNCDTEVINMPHLLRQILNILIITCTIQ